MNMIMITISMSLVSTLIISSSHSFLFLALFCHAASNTITKDQSLKDGETLISVDEKFEMGFFSPGNSSQRYVGIWYYKIQDQAVIWVANRDKPIPNRKGVLRIGEDGNLLVLDGNGSPVWTSNASFVSNNTVAMLDITGNLIILSSNYKIGDPNKVYWQSFNNPTDAFLPHMKVLASSAEIPAFTSWKSANDPSPGNFTMGVDHRGAPQIVVWEKSRRRWRSGYWNGVIVTGVPDITFAYGSFTLTLENFGNMYFTYMPSNISELMRLTWDGFEEHKRWNEREKKWQVTQSQPVNDCELYNYCGNFGVCSASRFPKCRCMEGFVPMFEDQWENGNWSGGCKRKSPLQCQRISRYEYRSTGHKDVFKAFMFKKLPDLADMVEAFSLDNCEDMCLSSCSCTAFADIAESRCIIWKTNLIDTQDFDQAGQILYLRLAGSESGINHQDLPKMSTNVIILIVLAGLASLAIAIWLLWMIKRKCVDSPASASVATNGADLVTEGSPVSGLDLPIFSFNSVAAATNHFSEENKLGQGGFGFVYKGKLPGGEEIAVKRLSKLSGQGFEEFKNEVILIAKLQHRNLVRLLGCSIQGEEKMLIYEYLANKSLDYFLFDPEKQGLLDWSRRFAIIEGIARGLLYLHRDSRLKIIHRDLKASNILLDKDMNPKISDFGMARVFRGSQSEINTNRVVGTYGYMSPEYAMEGLYSTKSDVYSFGALLLEVVSGRRNNSFRLTDCVSLIALAWELWNGGKEMEMVDPAIRDSCNESQVLKCIQVGLLCVQDSEIDRPDMESVVRMFESSTANIPLPRPPIFTYVKVTAEVESLTGVKEVVCSNNLTNTMVEGR